MENSRPTFSIIISTFNRTQDLAELFDTILKQTFLPSEIIVIDDGSNNKSEVLMCTLKGMFLKMGVELKYVRGRGEGLTAARNKGVKISDGDILLFLDDDVLLDSNYLEEMVKIYQHPNVLGAQGLIEPVFSKPFDKFENAICKLFLLDHFEKDRWIVLPSGSDIFPNPLAGVITCQRLIGCCFSFRREIFYEFHFDERLKRWGFGEDADFSYRVYKKYPDSLFITPKTFAIHKLSKRSRPPTKTAVYMATVYKLYFHFKNIEQTHYTKIALVWSMSGRLACTVGRLISKRKSKQRWRELVYLVGSYLFALNHLTQIKKGNLQSFNKILRQVTYVEPFESSNRKSGD